MGVPQIIRLTHVTIVHNSQGLLLLHDWAEFRIKNSILAGAGCYINIGAIVSDGHNIFTHPCPGLQTQPSDQIGIDPQLEDAVPVPGSPAIDAIPSRACAACPPADLRGIHRPQLYSHPGLPFTVDTPVYDIGPTKCRAGPGCASSDQASRQPLCRHY